jgi:hypothetical protein
MNFDHPQPRLRNSSSKPVTPKTLQMLSIEELKKSLIQPRRSKPVHRKLSSLPSSFDFPALNKSLNSNKRFEPSFFYFSRVEDPQSRVQTSNKTTRRKLINGLYTRSGKSNKKLRKNILGSGIFENEAINYQTSAFANVKSYDKKYGELINQILGSNLPK